MERKMFGKVVAALRKEQLDFDNGNSWSQEKLAEETGLTTRIVGKIERGRQVRLDRATLQELARAFRLTSLERREFFAMASEITDDAIVRADLKHQEVFSRVWATLGTICTPAFLMDSFGDLVGANRAVLDFHRLNWSQFNAARSSAGNVNILSLLLAPDAPIRSVLGPGWQAIALANMRQWRVMTLRYRHTTHFRDLFSTLSAYPDFQMLWAASRRRVEDDNSRLRSHFYTHSVYGPVAYTVFTNISLSACGDLYLATFVPQNRDTGAVFQNLADKGNHPLALTPWPNPTLHAMHTRNGSGDLHRDLGVRGRGLLERSYTVRKG